MADRWMADALHRIGGDAGRAAGIIAADADRGGCRSRRMQIGTDGRIRDPAIEIAAPNT
ncbi:hypothetical protein [Longimicrobium sp.]|uniref:hypothetical protein n=1 Tax=Longimicrobium sp. TaxID=2029185 RepID=UPI002E3505BE|nr:hypothetical protein [Longimicrobium sp.]HEX6042057.1 hypothetical protein [Longimicrobium sp.]